MPFQINEIKLFNIINSYRQSRGLKRMTYDDKIAAVACAHSSDMATGRCEFGHDGFDDRVKLFSTTYSQISENVAYYEGHPLNEEIVVQFWLKSNRHLEIVTGDYDMSGVGVAKSPNEIFYITQLYLKS